MLRLLILLLLLANVTYFAWTNGALAKLGFVPAHQTEPDRIQQQVHLERLLVTPALSAPAALAAPSSPSDTASAPTR